MAAAASGRARSQVTRPLAVPCGFESMSFPLKGRISRQPGCVWVSLYPGTPVDLPVAARNRGPIGITCHPAQQQLLAVDVAFRKTGLFAQFVGDLLDLFGS
jgi:hypothetical protein